MKARAQAVQRTLWALPVASLVLCVLAFPFGDNRTYMDALRELQAFHEGFGPARQSELESSLLAHAQQQGSVPLSAVSTAIKGPGVPKTTAAPNAAAILPRARIELRTLEQMAARSREGSTLPVESLRAADLGAAIAWRLSRLPAGSTYTLTKIDLLSANVSEADVSRERETSEARSAALAAEPAFARATRKLESAEKLYEARRKWRAPWKSMLKADEARKEARAELAERERELNAARARYEGLSQRAQKAEYSEKKSAEGFGLAKVELRNQAGALIFRIPVKLDTRIASLPPIKGTGFAATANAGLWEEVKGKTADQAIAAVSEHFTWHYRHIEIAGMALGGMTLLHVLPLILPGLLLLLLLRMRRVSTSYNPFGVSDATTLPRVGLGARPVELSLLAILPFTAAVLAVISLIAIDQIPVLPVIAGLASLGLGAVAFGELGALEDLLEAVVRSHSNPPPAKPAV